MGGTIGILALQGASAAHEAVLSALGVTPIHVRTPEELGGVDALILPGGESTTISFLLDSSGLRGPLVARLANGMPTFGTCAGMILLASDVAGGRADQRSLGALDIGVRRNAFGRQVDSFEADLAVAGLGGDPFHAVFIRAPFVERVGPGVEVLATVDDHPVICRQGPILVTAFHPELTDDARLHQLFLKELTE